MSGGQQASMIFKDSEYKAESWEFLKWWASEETQLSFSSHMINTYGKKYLWNTANQDAFQKLNWDKDDKAVIMEQWSWLKEVAKIPGSYIIEREISNIWNQVVFNDANLRSTISDSIIKQDKEISRKMQEFGYMDEQGKVIKTYIYPTAETVKKWKEGGK
jgi:ABC-type glycerol-3-phosphate transport system substrate-binding protein